MISLLFLMKSLAAVTCGQKAMARTDWQDWSFVCDPTGWDFLDPAYDARVVSLFMLLELQASGRVIPDTWNNYLFGDFGVEGALSR